MKALARRSVQGEIDPKTEDKATKVYDSLLSYHKCKRLPWPPLTLTKA